MHSSQKNHEFHTIDGKALAEEILLGLRKKIVRSKITPGLAVILVGNDPASELYVRNKEKACLKVGIDFHKYFCSSEGEEKIIEMIRFLNNDPAISGIIVQLPLPKGYDTQKIIDAIDPKKDADGFHPENIKKILSGQSKEYPPLVNTILYILHSQNIDLKKKKVAIISKSGVFAPVMKKALDNDGATPYTITLDNRTEIKEADIIISVVGKPCCITGEMIKKDAVIIDVGITKTKNGFCGDADIESIKKIASAATPTPGGTGPMTVAMLLQSTFDLAEKQ